VPEHAQRVATERQTYPAETNPNGLALLPGGRVLVTDAANNDLLKVVRRGGIATVARFKREMVPWPAGLPFPGPPPGTPVPAESVPTAVAIGPDGAWYVSELQGFPSVKGHLWHLAHRAGERGRDLRPGQPEHGALSDGRRGFTSVIDLAFGRKGTMYVLGIAKEGLLAAEVFGAPPIGALWAVKGGTKTELALAG
jgi:hypothetical protein